MFFWYWTKKRTWSQTNPSDLSRWQKKLMIPKTLEAKMCKVAVYAVHRRIYVCQGPSDAEKAMINSTGAKKTSFSFATSP